MIVRNILAFIIVTFFSVPVCFAETFPVWDVTYGVELVYQNDNNEKEFEFIAKESNGDVHQHRCNGSVYRVKSGTLALANRKFTLVTSAFMADYKLHFRETGVCSSDGFGRMEISWIQLKRK